ncbi:MAG: hypothetical protein ACJARN_001314 [Arenicella sp.]|jgi:hypothetical protein
MMGYSIKDSFSNWKCQMIKENLCFDQDGIRHAEKNLSKC